MRNPFDINTGVSGSTSKNALEWEESALDGSSQVEGYAEETRPAPKILWATVLLFIVSLAIAGQLFNLQILQGSRYKVLADGNRLRIQWILAPRGNIVDRNGDVLARNEASFSLVVTPIDIPKEGSAELFSKVAQLFGIQVSDIEAELKEAKGSQVMPIVIKRGLTQKESILFETYAAELPGFSIASIPIRDYVNAEMFSHALGYTGAISEREMADLEEQGYISQDLIGKAGIEQSYEKFLKGINGNKQVEVDASGKPIKTLGDVEPTPGNIAKLNIDAGLQEKIYSEFKKSPNNLRGAAVAMDPRTGAILALVSLPGYNNNLFAPGISAVDYQKLLDDKSLPLFNRAIAGVYPPGSTIKMVTAAAALEEKVVDSNTLINDNGVLVIPNAFNPSIQYNFYGWKKTGLGPMNVRSAIAQSSDIYFYTVAGGHPLSSILGLGAEKLASYYRKFGMGKLTGIDIAGEKPGNVADPNWKLDYYKGDAIKGKWYLGDTYHISIGQGDMLTTPLQVAVWTAAIANNGTLNKPTILKEILDQRGSVLYKPNLEQLIFKSISDEHMRVIQAGMRDNVTSSKGSGRTLQSLPMSAAGKTGTSQFDGADPMRTHAWYTAYAPFENPEIVITVLVEAGGEGHAVAVPIVKNSLQWWAENRMKIK